MEGLALSELYLMSVNECYVKCVPSIIFSAGNDTDLISRLIWIAEQQTKSFGIAVKGLACFCFLLWWLNDSIFNKIRL